MSEELRPCPFCGGQPRTVTESIDPDDLEFMSIDEIDDPDYSGVTCGNDECVANGWWLSQKDWNTRPIEDGLRKRIAELEAEVTKYHELQDSYCDRIAELEAENAELKERVAMLDVTAVYKSLGEMRYIEQVDKLNARIAELEAAQVKAKNEIYRLNRRITELLEVENG